MNDDFQVRDKRRLDPEGNLKEECFKEQKIETRPQKKLPENETQQSSEVFISFLMNLSTMASNAMGLGPNPHMANLQDAKYIIEVIEALEEKTKGNLTQEEDTTLKSIIYELRMRYIRFLEKVKPKK